MTDQTTEQYPDALYRPCVGIMLLNKQKQVFVGKRKSGDPETWQMPQGGMNPGETVIEAGLRELYEETGVQNIEILAETTEWIHYDLPDELVGTLWDGTQRGQKQKWLLTLFLDEDSSINISRPPIEFVKWKWLDPAELSKVVVPYKLKVYVDVLEAFKPVIESIET